MKGIILAGGAGTRLSPLTSVVSKQLLPVYDKPMIFYPLSVLMLAGIKDILIITTPNDIENYKRLLSNGNQIGVSISYAIQAEPKGLPEAFIIGEDFIDGDDVMLVLGDNIFFGPGFSNLLNKSIKQNVGGTIFSYVVPDPERFGVVEVNEDGLAVSIEEKPQKPRSSRAIVGLYIYKNNVINLAKELVPSSRGELEISDLNQAYLEAGNLKVTQLPRGFAWLDTGTFDSLLDASIFVKTIGDRQGLSVSSPEEIAFRQGWISSEDVRRLARKYNNAYGTYLAQTGNEQ